MKKAYVIFTMLIATVVYPEVTLDTLQPLAVIPMTVNTLDTQDLTIEQLAQLKLLWEQVDPILVNNIELQRLILSMFKMDPSLVNNIELQRLMLSLSKISPDKLMELGSYINLMANYLAEIDVPRHSYYFIRIQQILNQVSKAEDFTPEIKVKLDDLIARMNKLRGRK